MFTETPFIKAKGGNDPSVRQQVSEETKCELGMRWTAIQGMGQLNTTTWKKSENVLGERSHTTPHIV